MKTIDDLLNNIQKKCERAKSFISLDNSDIDLIKKNLKEFFKGVINKNCDPIIPHISVDLNRIMRENYVNEDFFDIFTLAITQNASNLISLILQKRPAYCRQKNEQGNTCLHLAAKCNHIELVLDFLLREPKLVTAVNHENDSAADIARKKDLLNIQRLLSFSVSELRELKKLCKVLEIPKETALFIKNEKIKAKLYAFLCFKLHDEKEWEWHRLIFKIDGINCYYDGKYLIAKTDQTWLGFAVLKGLEKSVEFLLAEGADPTQEILHLSYRKKPFDIALEKNNLRIINLIYNHKNFKRNDIKIQLAMAAIEGNLQLITDLLTNNNFDINTPLTPNGVTLLFVAAGNGHSNVVEYLLNHSAKLESEVEVEIIENQQIINVTFLYNVIRNNQENMLKFLYSKDENFFKSRFQLLYLYAINFNNFSILKVLLNWNFNINQSYAENGKTPLMFACENSDKKMVVFLIEQNKANVNVTDKKGLNALMYALKSSNLDVAEYLITLPDIDFVKKDSTNNTVLHWAMRLLSNLSFSNPTEQYTQLIRILLQKAEFLIYEKNSYGETPLDIAQKKFTLQGNSAFEILLKKYKQESEDLIATYKAYAHFYEHEYQYPEAIQGLSRLLDSIVFQRFTKDCKNFSIYLETKFKDGKDYLWLTFDVLPIMAQPNFYYLLLREAIENDHKNLLETIIKKMANKHSILYQKIDAAGNTLLHIFASKLLSSSYSENFWKSIFDNCIQIYSARNNESHTPLMCAIFSGNTNFIIQWFKHVRISFNSTFYSECVMVAIKHNNTLFWEEILILEKESPSVYIYSSLIYIIESKKEQFLSKIFSKNKSFLFNLFLYILSQDNAINIFRSMLEINYANVKKYVQENSYELLSVLSAEKISLLLQLCDNVKKKTLLFEVIEKNNLDLMLLFIQSKIDLNVLDGQHNTLLIFSYIEKHDEMLMLLLSKKMIDLYARNAEGKSLLYYVASDQNVEIFHQIKNFCLSQPSPEDAGKFKLELLDDIERAIKERNFQTLKFLLNFSVPQYIPIAEINEIEKKLNDVEIKKILKEITIKTTSNVCVNQNGKNSSLALNPSQFWISYKPELLTEENFIIAKLKELMGVSFIGEEQIVEFLRNYPDHIRALVTASLDNQNSNLMHYAAHNNFRSLIKFLADNYHDEFVQAINAKNLQECISLHYAAASELAEDKPIIEILMKYSSCEAKRIPDKSTPVHIALFNHRIQFFELAYQKNPKVIFLQNQQDYNPFLIAVYMGFFDVVKNILRKEKENGTLKSCLESVTHLRNNALHLAVKEKHFDIIQLLIEAGININLQDVQGNTPLHFAMLYSVPQKITDFLIQQLADGSIKNIQGNIPSDIQNSEYFLTTQTDDKSDNTSSYVSMN